MAFFREYRVRFSGDMKPRTIRAFKHYHDFYEYRLEPGHRYLVGGPAFYIDGLLTAGTEFEDAHYHLEENNGRLSHTFGPTPFIREV